MTKQVIETASIKFNVKKRKALYKSSDSQNSGSEENSILNEKGNICRGCGENY